MVLAVATQVVALHCVAASRVFPSSSSFIEAFLLKTGSLNTPVFGWHTWTPVGELYGIPVGKHVGKSE